MKSIGIVGFSKSGKTTLVERLIPLLAQFGKVGTVKHVPHHEIDASGDTHRHRVAGAQLVAAVTPETVVLVEPRSVPTEQVLFEVLSELQRRGVEFALVEGFKKSHLPKVVLGDIEADDVILRVNGEPDVEAIVELIRNVDDYDAGSISWSR